MIAGTFLGVFFAVLPADSVEVVAFADPAAVVADGRIEPGEWARATTLALSEGVSLHLMADRERLYLATSSRAGGPRYTDLYIDDGSGGLVNLHASMRVGERALPPEGWDDGRPAWSWGNNSAWTANTVSASRTENGLAFAPFDGQEFVLDRSRFEGEFLVRIEVRDFLGEAPDVTFPAGSTREHRSTWAVIRLSGAEGL